MNRKDAEKFRQKVLEIHKKTFVANHVICESALEDVKFDTMADAAHLQMVVQMGKVVASNKLTTQEIASESVPATGWDFIKTCMPHWVQRRWPPRMRRIVTAMDFYHMCPHLSMDRKTHVEFLTDPGMNYVFGERQKTD